MKIQSRRMPNPVDANWIPIRIGPPNQLHRSPESIEYVAITEAHRGTDRIRTNACMHTCDQTDARDTVGTFRSPSARVQIFRSKGGCFCQNYFQQTRACPLRRVLFTWLLRWFHPWNYNLVNGGRNTYWFFGVEVSSLSIPSRKNKLLPSIYVHSISHAFRSSFRNEFLTCTHNNFVPSYFFLCGIMITHSWRRYWNNICYPISPFH